MRHCDHCDSEPWAYAFSFGYNLCALHYEMQFEEQKRRNQAALRVALKEKRLLC